MTWPVCGLTRIKIWAGAVLVRQAQPVRACGGYDRHAAPCAEGEAPDLAGALIGANQHARVPHISPQVAAAGCQAVNLAAERDADHRPVGSGSR